MQTDYPVIIIGGGTSGLMAAIHAAQTGTSVLILEKNRILGKKLLLSGGGRCNVTNRTSQAELIKHIPGNGRFLYSALSQFDQEDIIHFFNQRGIQLKEEDHGRMFPTTDRSATIRDALVEACLDLGVDIQTKTPVDKIRFNRGEQKVEAITCKNGQTYTCRSLVVACGGRAYPGTGATGDGYAWAKAAGHTIERLYPTEAPLLSDDSIIKEGRLKGVALRDVKVTLWNHKGKEITHHQMDMLFTHFGYSGPAILRTSGHLNQYLYDSGQAEAGMTIDLQPNHKLETLKAQAENQRDKEVLTILKQWMPEALAQVIIECLGLNPHQAYKQVQHKDQDQLFKTLKAFPITAKGSQAIEKGFVTGGGVSTKEVNPTTMESKYIQGLFFCGEFLDLNGYTGGYNISSAFITGAVAGQHAGWTALT